MKVKAENPDATANTVSANKPENFGFEKSLVFFTGKGGVGKTCMSSAYALAAARSGKRVLLCEMNSTRQIPPLFGIETENDGPYPLPFATLDPAGQLDWINFTPQKALQTYALKTLKLKTVYRAVFENQAVRRFLKAVPSLAEILILGHLTDWMESQKHDLLIVDAPSSGPGLLMLFAPQAVIQSAPRGALFDGAVWIQNLLSDPQKTAIHMVTIPEDLPVSETIEFYHRLKNEVGLPLGSVFVNRTLDDFFPTPFEPWIQKVQQHALGQPLAQAAFLYLARFQLQKRHINRLQEKISLPLFLLNEFFASPSEVVTKLALVLEQFQGGNR